MSCVIHREDEIVIGLIALCRETANSFAQASQQAHDYELKAVLREFAYLRSQMAQLLQGELKLLDTSISQPAIAVKPAWSACAAAQALFSSSGDLGVLRRCGRSEYLLLEQYRSALAEEVSPRLEPILRRHCQIITLGTERLRNLRRAHQVRRRESFPVGHAAAS
jgi:uncharacterized protein (TIGR02284 family)